MKKNKKATETDQVLSDDWKKVLMSMDVTLRTAQSQIRNLERVVSTIRERVGVV